jgi:hypothetical protein
MLIGVSTIKKLLFDRVNIIINKVLVWVLHIRENEWKRRTLYAILKGGYK